VVMVVVGKELVVSEYRGYIPFLMLSRPEKLGVVIEVAEEVERFYGVQDGIAILRMRLYIPTEWERSSDGLRHALEHGRYTVWRVLWLYVKPELMKRADCMYPEDFAAKFMKLLRSYGYVDTSEEKGDKS